MARPGFRKHRKFRRLMDSLGLPEPHVLGHVEMLWDSVYEAGEERLGDSKDVELAAGWQGAPGALTEALKACGGASAGLIDEIEPGIYAIHDLWDHAPSYVAPRRRREQERKKEKQCAHCGINFRSSDSKARFCTDTCRKLDWKANHQSGEGDEGRRSGSSPNDTGDDGRRTETQNDDTPSPSPSPSPPIQLPSSCAEVPLEPSSPVVVVFLCVGKGSKEYPITQPQVDQWQIDYPGVNVPQELRSMRAWLEANPTKRKTAKGIPAFVVNWLNRTQNKPGAGAIGGARSSQFQNGGPRRTHEADQAFLDQLDRIEIPEIGKVAHAS